MKNKIYSFFLILVTAILLTLLVLSCQKKSPAPKPLIDEFNTKSIVRVMGGNPSLDRVLRIIRRTQEFCAYKHSSLKQVKIWHDDKANNSKVKYTCDIW